MLPSIRCFGSRVTTERRCWPIPDVATESGFANQHAAEQRDEADEGRVEEKRSMVGVSCHGVAATKDHDGVVRPSQLIASVRRTSEGKRA